MKQEPMGIWYRGVRYEVYPRTYARLLHVLAEIEIAMLRSA